MPATIAPLAKFQFNQGNAPLAGGLLFTYAAGTTTKLATYTDSSGSTPQTNPIVLDSNGQCSPWLIPGQLYKFVLSPPTDTDPPSNPYWVEDNVQASLYEGVGQVFFQPEVQTATSGQTIFTLTTITYAAGTAGAISVYQNGVRLVSSLDFVETSNTVVTMNTPAVAGDQFEFVAGQEVGYPALASQAVTSIPSITWTQASVTGSPGLQSVATYEATTPGPWLTGQGRCSLSFDFTSTNYFSANPIAHFVMAVRHNNSITTSNDGHGAGIGNTAGFAGFGNEGNNSSPVLFLETFYGATPPASNNYVWVNAEDSRAGAFVDGTTYRMTIDSTRAYDGSMYIRGRAWQQVSIGGTTVWQLIVDTGDNLDSNAYATFLQSGVIFAMVFGSSLTNWTLAFTNIVCTWSDSGAPCDDQSTKVSRYGGQLYGALQYGTLTYTDTNILGAETGNANSYVQRIIQNANAGASASADIIVSNNLGAAGSYYGDFGINSSTFGGTGSFSLPNATYLYAANGDLVIGTYTANGIHIVVNNGATDSASVASSGMWTFNQGVNLAGTTSPMELAGSVGLSGQVFTSSGPGATPVWSSAGSSMVYPSAGIPSSTGTAWGASYGVTGSGSVVLSSSPTLVTPALGVATATSITASSGITTPSMNGGQIAGFRNWVMNGDMSVPQAGTSFALTGAAGYTLDGCLCIAASSTPATFAQVAYTGNFQCALRVQRNSGTSLTGVLVYTQSFESRDVVKFAGKTMTLSFRARAGANFSAASNQISVAFYYGTGTDGNMSAGFTGQAQISTNNVTLTTSDAGFSVQVAVPSNATQFAHYFTFAPTGTAGTNDYFDITGVQLEVGSVATPFEQITYQQNLMRCMRHYQSSYYGNPVGSAGNQYCFLGGPVLQVPFQVPMRAVPTISYWDAAGAASKISTFTTGLAGTNGVTPTIAPVDVTINGFHVSSTTYMGIAWAASARL